MEAGEAPSLAHPFGTDDLGRDLLARNLYGGRISLAVGFAAMLIAMLVGAAVGLLSGFARLDNLLMRFTDMMFDLPQLPLLLGSAALFKITLRMRFGTGIRRLHPGGHGYRHFRLDANRAHRARLSALDQTQGICRGRGQRRRTRNSIMCAPHPAQRFWRSSLSRPQSQVASCHPHRINTVIS
jgi:hypothetical protein